MPTLTWIARAPRIHLSSRPVSPAARGVTLSDYQLGSFTALASRTLQLSDLTSLLAAVPEDGPPGVLQAAVVEDNLLLKPTAGSRVLAFKYLRQLYALDSREPVFAALRVIWPLDAEGRPLLALLAASTRDVFLRAGLDVVREGLFGSPLSGADFSRRLVETYGRPLGPKTLRSAGSNLASSFVQSGHLKRGKVFTRARAQATPGSVALAMFIGHLLGERGVNLFVTPFALALDARPEDLDALAYTASRRGWLEYRRLDQVAEFGFRTFEGLTAIPAAVGG